MIAMWVITNVKKKLFTEQTCCHFIKPNEINMAVSFKSDMQIYFNDRIYCKDKYIPPVVICSTP